MPRLDLAVQPQNEAPQSLFISPPSHVGEEYLPVDGLRQLWAEPGVQAADACMDKWTYYLNTITRLSNAEHTPTD